MEVITIESNAYKQLIEKIDSLTNIVSSMDTGKQENDDDKWIDGTEVCLYLQISERTLQRLRTAQVIPYSNIGGKCYYQISQIKKLLRERTIKSTEQNLQNLVDHYNRSRRKKSPKL